MSEEQWLFVDMVMESARREPVTEILEELGAAAITEENAGPEHGPVRHPRWPSEFPRWTEIRLRGLFPPGLDVAKLTERVVLAGATVGSIEPVGERDWVRETQQQFPPIAVGARLWIVPSWADMPPGVAPALVLDPGLAFGTGSHPTTRLCLETLAGMELAGRRVLDYGCGSGVIAIAALRLGAAAAVGVDNDGRAITSARHNAVRNGVAGRLAVRSPEEVAPGLSFDVVVANILSGTLIDLAGVLHSHVAPDGVLLLSGILPEHAGDVAAVYRRWFSIERRESHGWVLLEARHGGSDHG